MLREQFYIDLNICKYIQDSQNFTWKSVNKKILKHTHISVEESFIFPPNKRVQTSYKRPYLQVLPQVSIGAALVKTRERQRRPDYWTDDVRQRDSDRSKENDDGIVIVSEGLFDSLWMA